MGSALGAADDLGAAPGAAAVLHHQRAQPGPLVEPLGGVEPADLAALAAEAHHQRAGDVRQFAVVHSGDQHALERNQDHEAVAEYVVVQRTEELGHEERGETALTEQPELVLI